MHKQADYTLTHTHTRVRARAHKHTHTHRSSHSLGTVRASWLTPGHSISLSRACSSAVSTVPGVRYLICMNKQQQTFCVATAYPSARPAYLPSGARYLICTRKQSQPTSKNSVSNYKDMTSRYTEKNESNYRLFLMHICLA